MKVLFCCCALLCALFTTQGLFAGDLVTQPAKPQPGATVTFRYTPDSTFQAAQNLWVYLYGFSETSGQPRAHGIALKKEPSGVWTGSINLAPQYVYATLKITDGKREDRRDGGLWELFVSRDGNKPVEGALLRAGISWMGSLPPQCSRIIDLPMALNYLQKELAEYPNNVQAKIAATSLAFELRELDEKTHRERIQAVLSIPFDTNKENYTRAMIRLKRSQNKPQEAFALERSFITKFPSSEIASDRALQDVQEAMSEELFIRYAGTYLEKFPATANAEQLQGYLVGGYARRNELPKAVEALATIRYPSAFGYNELARYWMQMDTGQEMGLTFARKALSIAHNPPVEHKPVYFTEAEWNSATNAMIPVIHNTMGSIYYQLGRDDESLAAFREVLRQTNNHGTKETFMQMISILRKRNQNEAAMTLATQATLRFTKDEDVLRVHRVLFDTLMTSAVSARKYDGELQFWLDSAKRLSQSEKIAARLDLPAMDGTIIQLDGKRVPLSEMRGKPVVLFFWSSWCEPCVNALPILQFMYNRWTPKVIFLPVNVWEEKGKDRLQSVKEFHKKNGYSMPLCVDPNDDLIKKFGVTGLPTRIFLDKDGKVQYREFGFGDPNQVRDSMDEILDILLSESFYAKKRP